MSWTLVVAWTVATLLITLTATAWRQTRALRRVLAAERTRARLMDAMYHRDVCALKARLAETRTPAAAVLAAAEHELDQALAIYGTIRDPKEGGSS
ncbi:hypothetical protein ACFRCX_30145 [Streptomyces sp. NPDC056652]|uniref:hypothetical protein n=1 Tax=Streptomyces sp. NPDC056652 TaxID=3345893 RepID=UPI0036957A7D